MKRNDSSGLGLFTVAIAALFLAGFLLLVVLGARSYRNTVALQDGNMHTRALLSYLATCVRANDTAGSLETRESENGPVLVVADGSSGYALRLYRWEGNLVEDYARKDAELLPEDAQVIGPTETFEISELENGLLSVTTDAGRVLLHTRCGEGGAG